MPQSPLHLGRGAGPKKGNAKECSNYRTIALISHASKVMLKILQARLQQYMNRELPDVLKKKEKKERKISKQPNLPPKRIRKRRTKPKASRKKKK